MKANTSRFILKNKGFTLIELLVSISILVFLAAGGVAAYREIARREVLDNAHQELKTNLSFVRQQALSGVKPPACFDAGAGRWRTLTAYRVDFGSNYYHAYAICEGDVSYKRYDLSTGVDFQTRPVSVLYKVIGDGVVVNGTPNIIIRATIGEARTRTVTLNNQGLIQ